MSRSRTLLLCLGLAVLQACGTLGPNALRQGRPAYNEAIAATNAEQYLSSIVRTRYGLPTAQLAVSNITASLRFSSQAGVNVGIGPSEDYVGNLVPLSGAVVYDENPTISYAPLQGLAHVRALLSPVPIDLFGLLLNVDFQPHIVLAIMAKRVNGVPNTSFYTSPKQEQDRRFARLFAIASTLSNEDKLTFFEGADKPGSYHVWIHDYLPGYRQEVAEFLALLDIHGIEADGADIVLPVVAALRRSVNQSIAVQTRSVLDIKRIASAAVDVPEADQRAGLTINFPKTGLPGDFIRVRRAAERPLTAAAATRFQNWWYYIAGDDLDSKQFFLLFETLMSVQLSESTGESRAPVLTVPVN